MATNNAVVSLPGPHNVTRETLHNGITVLVYENFAAQSVVIGGSLDTGSLLEDRTLNGVTAMTVSALMRGTETRDFDTINSALEDIGADISFSAGAHKVSFYGKSLAEDFSTLVDVFGDVTRHPTFPEGQVEKLRGEIITGLQMRQQDTRYRASRAFYETLYPASHPYHYSVRGTLDTVPRISADDLRAFHQTYFGPRGLILVVVGAVRAGDALDVVRAALGDWRYAQPVPPPLPELAALQSPQRIFVPLPGKTQADMMMGVPGPARRAPDYQAAKLANSILGQFGMMGRIGQTVREELGLAYYAGSSLDGGLGPGPWSISAGVNPANVDLALERIMDEVRRILTEPVSDEDMEDNKSYFIGHLPLQLESNEGIAGTLVNIETFNLGLDYLLNYRATISALSKEDVLAAAQHYLNPDAMVISVAGPEQTQRTED
jgi:zinc protease